MEKCLCIFIAIRVDHIFCAKSYMWGYCIKKNEKYPMILYNYRYSRKIDHPKDFSLEQFRYSGTQRNHATQGAKLTSKQFHLDALYDRFKVKTPKLSSV